MNKGDLLRHGGALDHIAAHYPNAPRPWIDLSTGINPWPWGCDADHLMAADALGRLPTQAQWEACRTAMAGAFGAAPAHVLPVPGSAMAISLLPEVLPAKTVAVLAPSYGDHSRAWSRAGATVLPTSADKLLAASADVLVICNPNNPDGTMFDGDAINDMREKVASRGGYVIVDEAYGELCPDLSMARYAAGGHLIVLRSFGKFYGLAGLRLGAVIAPQNILNALSRLLGDWPVSSLALDFGAKAYRDAAFQSATRQRLLQARTGLDNVLMDAGLAIAGGTDLFRYIETMDAPALWDHLARAGIYVRRFAHTNRHLRIGVPADKVAFLRLSRALKSWQNL